MLRYILWGLFGAILPIFLKLDPVYHSSEFWIAEVISVVVCLGLAWGFNYDSKNEKKIPDEWRAWKRRRSFFISHFVSWLPWMGLWTISFRVVLGENMDDWPEWWVKAGWSIWIFSFILSIILVLKFRCLNCKNIFAVKLPFVNPVSKKCLHCGYKVGI